MAKINVELTSIYMYRRLPFHLLHNQELIATVARTKATESHAQQYQNSFYHVNPTAAHSCPQLPWKMAMDGAEQRLKAPGKLLG